MIKTNDNTAERRNVKTTKINHWKLNLLVIVSLIMVLVVLCYQFGFVIGKSLLPAAQVAATGQVEVADVPQAAVSVGPDPVVATDTPLPTDVPSPIDTPAQSNPISPVAPNRTTVAGVVPTKSGAGAPPNPATTAAGAPPPPVNTTVVAQPVNNPPAQTTKAPVAAPTTAAVQPPVNTTVAPPAPTPKPAPTATPKPAPTATPKPPPPPVTKAS
jgi:hypothetical protein